MKIEGITKVKDILIGWAHLKISQKVFFKGEKLSARGILRARSVNTLTLLALKKPLSIRKSSFVDFRMRLHEIKTKISPLINKTTF
ncbi:MAG: hypothetical protein AAF847_05250 [Bacteroidota bacterium]